MIFHHFDSNDDFIYNFMYKVVDFIYKVVET